MMVTVQLGERDCEKVRGKDRKDRNWKATVAGVVLNGVGFSDTKTESKRARKGEGSNREAWRTRETEKREPYESSCMRE